MADEEIKPSNYLGNKGPNPFIFRTNAQRRKKLTETERYRQKRTETNRNGQEQTKTDRNRQK